MPEIGFLHELISLSNNNYKRFIMFRRLYYIFKRGFTYQKIK